MHISGTSHRLDTNRRFNGRKPTWLTLLVGLSLGLGGMHLLIARPMMRELAELKSELATVERNMHDLVGIRGQVWETSNLLTSLKMQQREAEGARAALKSIRQFQLEVIGEADETVDATEALHHLLTVQKTLLENRVIAEAALKTLADVVALQDQLVEQRDTTSAARAALEQLVELTRSTLGESADVEDARLALESIGRLKSQLIREGESLDAAQENACRFVALKNGLNDGADGLEAAQAAANELIALKVQILDGGDRIAAARDNAGSLIGLSEELTGESLDLVAAEGNLLALLSIGTTLRQQTNHVADAIETLEILSDLKSEIDSHVAALHGIRRDLLEIVVLETTVGRVVRVLEPLSRLADLRRLSEDEVREAARVILESRGTRVSGKPELPRRTKAVDHPGTAAALDFFDEPAAETNVIDRFVPLPIENEDD